MRKNIPIIATFLTILLSSCTLQEGELISDPFEKTNRKIFDMNMKIWDSGEDSSSTKKSSKVFKKRLGNFLNNLYEPINIVHDLLQADIEYAFSDFGRFFINSTFGIFGLFDYASVNGLPKHHQSVSKTLYTWGITETPYLMLPLLGPKTLTEVFNAGDTAAQLALLGHFDAQKPWLALETLNALANMDEATASIDAIKQTPGDPYVSMRTYYALRFHQQMKKTSYKKDKEKLQDLPFKPKP